MPDILISIRDGMKKLLLLKHDDGRGGGPAHINTHRFNPGNNKNAGNKRIVQFDLCWSVQGYLIQSSFTWWFPLALADTLKVQLFPLDPSSVATTRQHIRWLTHF